METAKNVANYVSESVHGSGASASKDANKDMAKDSNASLGSRATAAKETVVDKKNEKSHDVRADANKEAAKH